MNHVLHFLFSAFAIAFAFGIVIFVHEFGHFIVAKKSGVKVDRFSFGLGPEMFGFQWGETRYCIAWLPLGGEVRMAGEMVDGEELPPPSDATDRSREFFAQPWYRRIAIAFAGPFMNYLLAAVIFFTMLAFWGEPIQTNKTEVGQVVAGMPAEKAGFHSGDRILSVQGEPVTEFADVATKIENRAGQATDVRVQRAGQELTITVTPDPIRKKIGIAPADPVVERRHVGPLYAAKKSVVQCWVISSTTLYYLGQKIAQHERPDIAGPIGIGQVILKAVKTGPEDFFFLIGLISVAIGLFNLFPIPMLDGGHVLYYLIEGARGRPVSQLVMARANMVGMVFLLGLLAFATLNDFQRIRTPGQSAAAATATPEPTPAAR